VEQSISQQKIIWLKHHPGNGFRVLVFIFLKKFWKFELHAITFASVLYNHLSRKAEGHGPVKP